MNEGRVFSQQTVLDRIEELDVQLVKVDLTESTSVLSKELNRTEMKNLPVNLIYPANYPESPAIMLPEFLSPAQALEALDRIAGAKPAGDDESTATAMAGGN